jgi:hypothetical protein
MAKQSYYKGSHLIKAVLTESSFFEHDVPIE